MLATVLAAAFLVAAQDDTALPPAADAQAWEQPVSAAPPVSAEPPVPDAPPQPPPGMEEEERARAPRLRVAPPESVEEPDEDERIESRRPHPGLLEAQPWAVVMAAAGNVWALLAPVPMLFCMSAGCFTTALLVSSEPYTQASSASRSAGVDLATVLFPAVLAVSFLPVALLAVSAPVAWGTSVLLAALGLALPPSMDVAPSASGGPFRRVASPTSVVFMERLVTGRWPPLSSGSRALGVLGSTLLLCGGVGTGCLHAVAASVFAMAVTAAVVSGVVAAVALLIAGASKGDAPDLPDAPDPAPGSASASGGGLSFYFAEPWAPWWWLFWAPPPPLVVPPPDGGTPAPAPSVASPADERSRARIMGAMACAACNALPLDMAIRMAARAVGSLTGADQPDNDDMEDPAP